MSTTPSQKASSTRLAITIAIALLVVVGAFFTARAVKDKMFPVASGAAAPNFTAFTLDSVPKARTLQDYKGDVVMVNIWATWCQPCIVEMPSIEALYQSYRDKGLKVVAVSIDDAGSEENIRQFVQYKGLTFDVLHDPEGDIQDIYQTTGVPETLIIARDGTIRKKMTGAVNWNSPTNRALIEQLLAERAG